MAKSKNTNPPDVPVNPKPKREAKPLPSLTGPHTAENLKGIASILSKIEKYTGEKAIFSPDSEAVLIGEFCYPVQLSNWKSSAKDYATFNRVKNSIPTS